MATEYEYSFEGEEYTEVFESDWSVEHPEFVAEDAAGYIYGDCGDPEDYPIEIEIFHEQKSIGKFSVNIDFEPVFSATEIKSGE